jgi:hypothetical protein
MEKILNKKFSRLILVLLLVSGFLLLGAQAYAVSYTPDDAEEFTLTPPANYEPGVIYEVFPEADPDLELLYKAEYDDDKEEGYYAPYYETTFSGAPNNATISWIDGTEYIKCPECYLAIKDGNANPTYYVINLGTWDGKENIVLTGFWAGERGAISHVSIWGNSVSVPEPATMFLLGLGLVGMAGLKRKIKKV